MPREVFKGAFVSDLQRAALGAAPLGEPVAEIGEPGGDRPGFIAKARALRAAGALTPKPAVRAAQLLLDLGLAAEALELLTDRRFAAKATSFAWTSQTARGWLMLGVLTKAGHALDLAMAAAATDEERAAANLLARQLSLMRDRRAAASWPEALALAGEAVTLGLGDLAAAALRRQLSAGAPSAKADLDALLDMAFGVLRRCGGGTAATLIAAMSEIYEQKGLGEECRQALAGLRGVPRPRPPPIEPAAGDRRRLRACLGEAYAAAAGWPDAITRFAPAPEQTGMLSESLCELARCVGQDVLSNLDFRFAADGGGRIFDLFPFNGEFDLLELKLGEMSPWVDRFIIVEAAQTFTGLPKPLHFAARRDAFAGYADKITYLPIAAFPPHVTSPWAREFFQRDSAVGGLSGRCGPDDLVIISDVDEILRKPASLALPAPAVGAHLRTFQYFLNYEILGESPSVKSVFTTAKVLAGNGSSFLRTGVARFLRRPFIADAGWHFTSVGKAEALERKFQSYSHTEWSHLDRAHFEDVIEAIRNGGPDEQHIRRDLAADLPPYLQRHPELFADYLL